MKLLDIIHPAAKTLVDIAKSQDAEVSRMLHKSLVMSMLCIMSCASLRHAFLSFTAHSHLALTENRCGIFGYIMGDLALTENSCGIFGCIIGFETLLHVFFKLTDSHCSSLCVCRLVMVRP